MSASAARSLRILYIGTLPPHQGGSAITASQLLIGLADMGHQIEAIAPITQDGLRTGDRFAERNPSVKVLRFTMPYLRVSPDVPPAGEYEQREQREIEQLATASIARRLPDVILIGRESFAPHGVELARAHRIPSVLRFAGATTMGILNGTYPAPLAERFLERAREAEIAVAPAPHMQRALARLGLADVKVIPNPVDLKRFSPKTPSPRVRRRLAIGAEDLVVAHLSNLKPIKRPLDFVEAAEVAAREDERLVFVVAGDGPLRAEMEQACAERGIAERFRFPGWIDYELIPDTVNCADIIVMPSAGEGQARVYLETQACGRTLIASDIPAALEVIKDGQTGMLYRGGDTAQLAAKILLAASDPDLRTRLGRQARQAVASHSLTRIVALYDQLLGELTANASVPSAAMISSEKDRGSTIR
jgi:glycosyltransferase involved in cell wall biosynthesis